MNIEQARFNMIEQQVKPWKVFDEKILDAMSILPRDQFISEQLTGLSYADTHLPIGHNQTMLAPREIARLIQTLELSTTDKVLEIGTGSGYSSALLSKLSQHVFSVDIIADFVKSAKIIHKKLNIKNVTIDEGDASEGWMAHAPYNAVLITAALPNLTESLKKCLSQNGKVISILEHKSGLMATYSILDENKEWIHQDLFPVDAVSMINADKTNQFSF